MAPDTMFAWQYTGTSPSIVPNLRLEPAIPTPQLPANKPAMRVRVLRAAINPLDFKVAEIPIFGRFIAGPPPRTPGMDFVGRVEESRLTGFDANDLVVGKLAGFKHNGTLGQFIVVEEGEAVAKVNEAAALRKAQPEGGETDYLSALAGIGIAGSTALQALEGLGPGAKVFVKAGSGGTGTFAIQIAKALGLDVVTTCSTAKVDMVTKLGADKVLDYTKIPPGGLASVLAEEAKNSGKPFDRVIDNVGDAASLFRSSKTFLAPKSRYVLVGVQSKPSFFLSLYAARFLPTFLGGSGRPLQQMNIAPTRLDLETVSSFILDDKVKVVRDDFKLEDVPKAYELLKTGKAKGKIVVKIAEE